MNLYKNEHLFVLFLKTTSIVPVRIKHQFIIFAFRKVLLIKAHVHDRSYPFWPPRFR